MNVLARAWKNLHPAIDVTYTKTMSPLFFHVDMDAFFANVEALDNPGLRGKCVLIGRKGKRCVVSTASYEARAFGCHSAMPMAEALRLCPQAIVVPPRFERYSAVSKQIMDIFSTYSDHVTRSQSTKRSST